jgi:hypothetical protein
MAGIFCYKKSSCQIRFLVQNSLRQYWLCWVCVDLLHVHYTSGFVHKNLKQSLFTTPHKDSTINFALDTQVETSPVSSVVSSSDVFIPCLICCTSVKWSTIDILGMTVSIVYLGRKSWWSISLCVSKAKFMVLSL